MNTLVEVLQILAERNSCGETRIRFLGPSGESEAEAGFVALDKRARSIAHALSGHCDQGDRALLIYAPGLDFIEGFLGCLYAGVIAVPCYPAIPDSLARTLPRLRAIAADALPSVVLAKGGTDAPESIADLPIPELRNSVWLETDSLDGCDAEHWHEPKICRETVAFLQYTSGSTGDPKGVMVSHGNLLHNISLCLARRNRLMQTATEPLSPSEEVFVSWLPPYHDMGLIGMILEPICSGATTILMAPLTFLRRPVRWLEAITRYKGTVSAAPNFAYELCVRKIGDRDKSSLDLSSWRSAANGAEPVQERTLRRFAEAFGECGFRSQSFYPSYGLAEATLLVSGARKAETSAVARLDPGALREHRVMPSEDADAVSIVSCDYPSQKVIVANPKTKQQLGSNSVGEIWVSGPSVALGYWNRPRETEKIFHAYLTDTGEGPFLQTGDLGFVSDGQLYITGRLKDLIIIRGQNFYPSDIERSVERAHTAVRPGCTAAFSLGGQQKEVLVFAAEITVDSQLRNQAYLKKLAVAIWRTVKLTHRLRVQTVLLLSPRTIPKTSSGKIQRRACRKAYADNSLPTIYQHPGGRTPSNQTSRAEHSDRESQPSPRRNRATGRTEQAPNVPEDRPKKRSTAAETSVEAM